MALERDLCRLQVTGVRIRDSFGGNPVPPRREVLFDGRLKDLSDTVFLGSYVAPKIEHAALHKNSGRFGELKWEILPWTADHPRPTYYPLSLGERNEPVQGPTEIETWQEVA